MAERVKIVRFREIAGADLLRIDELPLPESGRAEVRLRVRAIGLTGAEIMFRNGQHFLAPKLPSNIGYEASGIVEAVVQNVDPDLLGKGALDRACVPAEQVWRVRRSRHRARVRARWLS